MAHITVKTNPTYTLELNESEANYLFSLIGNHILGEGKNREINTEIFDALDSVLPPQNHLKTTEQKYIYLQD